MKKNFFGYTYLDFNDEGFNGEGTVEIEYYKIKNFDNYGIELLKRECKNDVINIEKSNIPNISKNECIIDELLEKLKRNKVLPSTVEEIITNIF